MIPNHGPRRDGTSIRLLSVWNRCCRIVWTSAITGRGCGCNNQGGPQVGLSAPGAQAKYRLGNEAENYGRTDLRQDFHAGPVQRLDAPGECHRRPVASGSRRRFHLQSVSRIAVVQRHAVRDAGSPGVHRQRRCVATHHEVLRRAAAITGGMTSTSMTSFLQHERDWRRRGDIVLPFGKLAFAGSGRSPAAAFPAARTGCPARLVTAKVIGICVYDARAARQGEFGLTYARTASGL